MISQQAPNGAFFADLEKSTVSYESTALALATLGLVKEYSEVDHVEETDINGIANYIRNVPTDLAEVAAAHKALAHTPLFSDNFNFIIEYGGSDSRGNTILQGTQLRPEIVVRSFNGPSHSNLNVALKYSVAE